MMLNPLLILCLKTQVLTLPGKLQCLLFTLRNTEKKCWLRNSVLVCNCQKQWDIGVMLVVQHSVCMLLFMVDNVKWQKYAEQCTSSIISSKIVLKRIILYRFAFVLFC